MESFNVARDSPISEIAQTRFSMHRDLDEVWTANRGSINDRSIDIFYPWTPIRSLEKKVSAFSARAYSGKQV
jgi:hypothetical protein